jgi:glutathione synthase/RimK-type ligase-like ATP-grasp enzyme
MSKGNEAEAVEADEELKTLAVKAAQTLGIEFAGVDIIEVLETGKRYILEVNLSPQIFLSTQFGKVDIGEELVKYIISKISKKQ